MSVFEVSMSIFGAEFEGSIHAMGTISDEAISYGSLFLSYKCIYTYIHTHIYMCVCIYVYISKY